MPEKNTEFVKKLFDGKLVLKEGIEADQVYNMGMSYGQKAKHLECLQWFI